MLHLKEYNIESLYCVLEGFLYKCMQMHIMTAEMLLDYTFEFKIRYYIEPDNLGIEAHKKVLFPDSHLLTSRTVQ